MRPWKDVQRRFVARKRAISLRRASVTRVQSRESPPPWLVYDQMRFRFLYTKRIQPDIPWPYKLWTFRFWDDVLGAERDIGYKHL